MNSFSPAAKAVLVCACLPFALPVAAQDVVTVRVSGAGIDPATAAGRAEFRARIARSAERACASRHDRMADRAGADNCVREMRLDADAKLADIAGTDVAVAGN